jgi:hypothetical protein
MARKLPLATAQAERLGRPTIMDRALAAAHGPIYVHLAAFAIDVDRVREALESFDGGLPFGWEVFLTEAWLIERVTPEDPPARAMIEDAVLGILERKHGEEEPLGSQLPFAVWDAIARGAWPAQMRSLFSSWRARPDELVKELAPFWADSERHRRALARVCLEAAIDPPLAPPTVEALRAMAQ